MEVVGFTRQGLRASGFHGFLAVERFDEAQRAALSPAPAVVAVLREVSEPPVFRANAGSGEDAAADLEEAWVPGAEVLFLGAAQDLQRTVSALLNAERAELPDGFWRLRLLEDWPQLELVWKELDGITDPATSARELRSGFERIFGRPPFAHAS